MSVGDITGSGQPSNGTSPIPGMSNAEWQERVKIASQDPASRQFKWSQEQARKAEADALARRAAMTEGLGKIDATFAKFDDPYYKGVSDKYLAYANPQIDRAKADSEFDLRSNLANRGKLGSSTEARQRGDLATTYGGIYRDATGKAEEYAGEQRQSVNQAKQASIGQMHASESQDAGLQIANSSVQSLNAGPSFEPVTALLAQAAKFAQVDYNGSLYNGQSYGAFSPITNAAVGTKKTANTIT